VTGFVNTRLEATISFPVFGPSGRQLIMTAVIDTGYNGDLCLPLALVTSLSLLPQAPKPVKLGDNSWKTLPFYRADIDWDGRRSPVRVLCVEGDPLVGTRLLRGNKMEADFVDGGSVLIHPLP
jgi:predicted aspartyl protease